VLFGAHVSGGVSGGVARGVALGCDAIQVFTQSPRTWRHPEHAADVTARFREDREAAGLGGVVCHALYLCNLAGPDPEVRDKSLAALRATISTGRAIGAEGVVVHVGSHLGAGLEGALPQIVGALTELLELTDDRLWLLLENSAGAGGTIGRSLDELAVLVDALDRHPRLGLCLDSCHWFVSGVDVTAPRTLEAAVADLDARIGLDRLRCLHVNDAATALGSNRDRHASIGAGTMGEGLGTFLAHPAFQELPAILETPGPDGHGPDAEELSRLRALHRRGLARARRRRARAR
jgi:deoxyribonuclease-4